MTRVRVAVGIDAPRREVWEALRDIGSHVEWMIDATAIRFTSASTEGVGTTFDCDTRVGPFTLVDRMEVVGWRPGREIAIRHVGLVSGAGSFRLRRQLLRRGGGTRVVWSERLRFPWWMGGPVGGWVGGRVLAVVWRKDLRNLKQIVERGSGRRG